MSGIYIPGMEMPKNCLSCPLQGGTADCRLTQRIYNWGLTERPSDCPLVPVPLHGRLGDLDELEKTFREDTDAEWNRFACPANWADAFDDVADMIADAPTIIPAEESEPPKGEE